MEFIYGIRKWDKPDWPPFGVVKFQATPNNPYKIKIWYETELPQEILDAFNMEFLGIENY